MKSKFAVRNFHINGSSTAMKFEDLSPGLRYHIGITAENSIGLSNTSYLQVEILKEGIFL